MTRTRKSSSSTSLLTYIHEATKNITSTACNAPIRDKSSQYSAMSISFGVITVLIGLVRIIYKKFIKATKTLSPDDWVIIIALALRIPGIIINVQGLARHGLGRDVWTVGPELVTFAQFFFVEEVMYFIELSLIKLALSLFFFYIFPSKLIRRLLLGTTIFNALYGGAFVIAAIFQCTPISYFWTKEFTPSNGHCINLNVFGWVHAAISIVLDVWLIAIPLSQIPALKLHWKKKVGVIIMFLVGTL